MNKYSSKKDNPPAIVVGLDNFIGLQTTRILARRGIPVIAIAENRRHFSCYTNSTKKILIADTKSDALIPFLVSLGKSLDERAVLFPCLDPSVFLISRNQDQLKPYYHLPLAEHEVLETLMDKESFTLFCQKENLPIPKSYLLYHRQDAEQSAENIEYPCILKPSRKSTEWECCSPSKVIKVASAENLLNAYDQCASVPPPLIVQEWIPGDDSFLYSSNCYFNNDKEPLVMFIAKKIRQWPPEAGFTSLGAECRDDDVYDLSLRFFKTLPFRGLGYLEIKKHSETGNYYLIEANIGRPTGRSSLAEACGVELLQTAYCDLLEKPLPEGRQQKYIGKKWIHLRTDLRSATHYIRKGELTLKDWWKSISGPKTYAIFSLTDPLPFFVEIFTTSLSPARRFFKNLFRVNRTAR